MATESEANALGFITPGPADLIRDGDDAIKANALAAVDLYLSLNAKYPLAIDAATRAEAAAELAEAITGLTGEDDAVALLAETPGTALHDALSATYAAAGRVDFTAKPDGAAPATLDSGQAADAVFGQTGRKVIVSGGRLVPDLATVPPTAGSYATYYQTDLGADATRIGCEWTQPAGADDGNGSICLAAWANVYEGTGASVNVPQTRCHLVARPGTGVTGFWEYAVFRGDGSPYVRVKSGSFINPAADGETRWTLDVVFDEPAGVAHILLPDGTTATVTAAEVAAAFTIHSQTPIPFMDLAANTVVIEHFASAGGNTAKYAEFTGAWAEVEAAPESRKTVTPLRLQRTLATVPKPPAFTRYSPTTAATVAAGTSVANVDSTNVAVTGTYGPTGKILIELDAYYEFTRGADTVFGRMNGPILSALEAVAVGAAAQKVHLHHTFLISGGTPGATGSWKYQHSSISGNPDLMYGGSGAGFKPPIFLKATPV